MSRVSQPSTVLEYLGRYFRAAIPSFHIAGIWHGGATGRDGRICSGTLGGKDTVVVGGSGGSMGGIRGCRVGCRTSAGTYQGNRETRKINGEIPLLAGSRYLASIT